LNKYGFKISHIDKMSGDMMNEKILSLSQIEAQQERLVNELISCMIDMDIDLFETKLEDYIVTKGIERTVIQIIFPFLERIGILWLTNHINPGQEHLVTNIIRQKLLVGIENIKLTAPYKSIAVLFLPEGEHHELGILFAYFLLKVKGIKVIYVGANIPIKDIEFIAQYKKPSFLYCHLTSVAHNFNFEKFLVNAQNRLPEFQVVVSGAVTLNYKKRVPNNVSLKKSLSEVMDYISTL